MSEGAAKKEEKARKFQAIRGVRDILPPETALWTRVEQTAHQVFATYGYGEIRLPIIEETELFARSIGGETDVVAKEMYTFADRPAEMPTISEIASSLGNYARQLISFFVRAEIPQTSSNRQLIGALELKLKDLDATYEVIEERKKTGIGLQDAFGRYDDILLEVGSIINGIVLGPSVTLRPEATASVCRAYIEHNMQQLPQPVKLYTIGPMFRRERPQKGRYRQFYQIDAEVLETVRPDAAKDTAEELAKDAIIDAEVIEMLMTFFDKVGLQGTTLYINSIGHNAPNCRRGYVENLRAALVTIKDKLGADSQRRIETNPLRVLDSKEESEQPYIEKLPRITNYLCPECAQHYAALKRQLELRRVDYEENWRLVRGLDYYMRTTFEITAPGLGSQNAVCGGGRYDGLVELLGGPPTKGIGFAIGQDRLILSLQESLGQTGGTFDENLPSFSAALQSPDVAVTGTSKNTWDHAIELATSLRKRGLSVFLPRPGTKLQRAFDAASKLGIRVAILVGEDELKHNNYVIRVLSPINPSGLRDFPVQTRDVLLYGKVVKLRQDLERALLRIATGIPDLHIRHNIPLLIDRLLQKELLPVKAAEAIRNVVPLLNRAVHGESLAPDSIEWTLAFGNLLLNELEKLSPSEV